MFKFKFVILALVLSTIGCAHIPKSDLGSLIPLTSLPSFKPNQRILILAPHPDDESIACAGIIQKALKAGALVKVVYLTNGDHNEFAFIVYEKRLVMRQGEFIHMGKLRQQESIKAMKFLGLAEKDLVFLGYPDYGTFEIFCKYWRTEKPFRDRLTRISSVPYAQSPGYGHLYYGENILADLTQQILDYQPDIIFVSHPADVNVDHKSLYLFLQVALSDLGSRIDPVKIYPYLVHSAGWPKPRHYHPDLKLFPPIKFIGSRLDWFSSNLGSSELDQKYRSILFYKSQTQSAAFYLLSFARTNELFGDYPTLELKSQVRSSGKEIQYSDASAMLEEEDYPLDSKEPEPQEEKGFVSYAQDAGNFLVRLNNPNKSGDNYKVMLYAFGYSQLVPFAKMPKLRIIIRGQVCKVFNANDKITNSGVLVQSGKDALTIRIPLKLLGDPDYLLTALKSYHGSLPVDFAAFRKIKIK